MVLIKDGKEIARLVAKSDEGEIKALLMKAVEQWKFSHWSKSGKLLGLISIGEKIEVFDVFFPTSTTEVEIIEGDSPAEAGRALAQRLREARVI